MKDETVKKVVKQSVKKGVKDKSQEKELIVEISEEDEPIVRRKRQTVVEDSESEDEGK